MKRVELLVQATGYIVVDVPDDKLAEFESESGLPTPFPLDRLPASVEYDPSDLVNDLEFTVMDYDVLDDDDEDGEDGEDDEEATEP